MKGVYNAVARIRKALKTKERIAIFGDSDLDGITSLTNTL
jgi:single-stranded DNA-specific DHH superfamily exonuclease